MKISRKTTATGQSLADASDALATKNTKTQNICEQSPRDPDHESGKEETATGSKAPRVKFVRKEDRQVLTLDHPDQAVGYALLMKAIGTGDFDFLRGILGQLTDPGLGRDITEEQVNFMLSVIKGIEPTEQLQSLVGVLIAFVQSASVMVGTDLLSFESFAQRESSERSFTRLVRTLAELIKTLMRLRADRAQKITVRQNVSVGDGGRAAVVGSVTQSDNAPDTAAVSPPALSDATAAPMPIDESKKRVAGLRRYRPKTNDG